MCFLKAPASPPPPPQEKQSPAPMLLPTTAVVFEKKNESINDPQKTVTGRSGPTGAVNTSR